MSLFRLGAASVFVIALTSLCTVSFVHACDDRYPGSCDTGSARQPSTAVETKGKNQAQEAPAYASVKKGRKPRKTLRLAHRRVKQRSTVTDAEAGPKEAPAEVSPVVLRRFRHFIDPAAMSDRVTEEWRQPTVDVSYFIGKAMDPVNTEPGNAASGESQAQDEPAIKTQDDTPAEPASSESTSPQRAPPQLALPSSADRTHQLSTARASASSLSWLGPFFAALGGALTVASALRLLVRG
jgi:hypothetical protein